jgi:ketosteroid isomerase-like protein
MSGATAARGDASDHQALVDLNENYIRSVQESDIRWFEAHLSADFLNSNPDGSLVDRAGFLAQIAKPVTIKGLRCEDLNVRLEGDVAIIHARTTYTRPDGQSGAGRYTDIWARRQGRWVCIAAHVTRG